MKKARTVPLLLISLALGTSCFAQTRELAIINTDTFSDPHTGIVRLVQAIKSVDREFDSRRDELVEIKGELDRLHSSSGLIPTEPDRMLDQLKRKTQIETLRRLYECKSQEAQSDYNKRRQEVTLPVFDDISKSLEAFSKQRGIKLLLDANKMACSVPCNKDLMAKLDVTREFINEYNRLHPAAEKPGK